MLSHLKTYLQISFFLTALSVCHTAAGAIPGPGPNIIIIMADDLDSRQLSCYGGMNLQTGNIDRLATEGIKFNTMIASEAMCTPTRASLFTGLYPARHGSYRNHKPVNRDLKSVCHYLNKLGYRVGLTGKNHMTKPVKVFPFDIIPGFEPNCVSPTDEYFLDSVRQYIQQKDPYCLFVMSINPHSPWTVGNPDEFDPKKLKLPAHWVDTDLTRKQFCKYLAEVRKLDDQVGAILNMLKETGEDKNTIVVFLGEQGPQFPGGKWNLFDNGQKSSMIVRWPGVVKAGSETNVIVQYEDVTPTLIDIAGGSPVKNLDGKSFKQVLEGKTAAHRSVAYGIHNNVPEGPAYPIRSIRDNQYKLILNLMPDSSYYIKFMMNTMRENLAWTSWIAKAENSIEDKKLVERIVHRPAVEFYDIKNDPYELNNLAKETQYKGLIEKYRSELLQWMKEQKDTGASMEKGNKPRASAM